MKKKLLVAMILTCVSLTACGNTLSPAEAAANGTAPQSNNNTAAVASTETEDTATSESAEDNNGAAEDSTAEVVLNADPSQAASQAGLSIDDVAVKAGAVQIKIDENFTPNIDKVGEATIEEGQACLEGGYDTNYYYGGEDLVVYTIAKSGEQIIYDIYVSSADYITVKGATVGTSTKDDVKGMYGTPANQVGNSFVYSVNGGAVQAQFEFDSNDVLKTIDILKK